MIKLEKLHVIFNKRTKIENHILKGINLEVLDGQFITIIGGNGAGKSTLMNVLSGNISPSSGNIIINSTNVTKMSPENRSLMVSRVFQDPMIGTFSDLSVEENMSLAMKRGKRRGLSLSIDTRSRNRFKEALSDINIGLENRLTDKVTSLSGGQRQALSLIMATLLRSKVLLLDEHTAALDPKTAKKVMQITDMIVRRNKLTVLMITHSMTQALEFGNRTLMMQQGKIIHDIFGDERKKLLSVDLMKYFD